MAPADPRPVKPRFRRVVTGEDEAGLSLILRDSVVALNDLRAVHWFTERSAEALRQPPAEALHRMPMGPPSGATTFQIVVVPPQRPDLSDEDLEAYYARTFNGSVLRGDTARHPGMHRTSTIDYVVVLEGELTLILGHDETVLRPFDTVVQRGTEHAWANRGDCPATFAVVTLDQSIAGIAQPERRGALELAALYGLTPVETEVALALAEGQRLTEIAANRNVSLNTVRTHVARLRVKLNATTQAEIVRTVFLRLGVMLNGGRNGNGGDRHHEAG